MRHLKLFSLLALSFAVCACDDDDDNNTSEQDASVSTPDASVSTSDAEVSESDAEIVDSSVEELLDFELQDAGIITETSSEMEAIAEVAEKLIEREYAPGLAVALVHKDTVEYKGFGQFADIEDVSGLGYEMASTTKAFIGMTMASMVQDGLITVDTKLSDCLPPSISTLGDADEITLGMLATHTAGFLHDIYNLEEINEKYDLDSNYYFDVLTLEELWENLENHPQGGSYSYSNVGIAILGHALAFCDGEDNWETMVQHRVLEPMGLSGVNTTREIPYNVYDSDTGETTAFNMGEAMQPCGSFRADLSNMAHLARIFLNDLDQNDAVHNMLNLSTEPLLDPTNTEEGYTLDSIGMCWNRGYGELATDYIHNADLLAFSKDSIRHSGGSRGTSSSFGVFPNNDLGIIFFANSSATHGDLVNLMMTLKSQNAAPALINRFLDTYYPDNVLHIDEEQAAKYIGTYKSTLGDIIKISAGTTDWGSYALWFDWKAEQIENKRLWYIILNKFSFFRGYNDYYVKFNMDEDGNATSLSVMTYGTYQRVSDN